MVTERDREHPAFGVAAGVLGETTRSAMLQRHMEPAPFASQPAFPPGFLWGTATSSHQVEGGNEQNDWSEWEKAPGRIARAARAGRACDWWAGRAEGDLSLSRELG